MFCKGCGNKVTAAYCPGCGAVKAEEWTQVNVDLVEEKFCAGCGKPVTAAFCCTCGKQRKTAVTVGKASAFGGFGGAVSSNGYAADAVGGAPVGATNTPVPVAYLLMGVVFLFALATQSLLMGFALMVALAPSVMAVAMPKLYNDIKGFVNLGAAVGALLLVIFSLALSDLGINVVGFLLALVVVAVIAFIGLRSLLKLKLPTELENLMSFVEGPMYFYWVALILSVAGLFRPSGISSGLSTAIRNLNRLGLNFGHLYTFSFGRFILMAIFTVLLLAPPIALAFFLWRRMTFLVKYAVAAMAFTSFLSLIFIPVYFARRYLVPSGYVVFGFFGVALAAVVVFLLKEYVMDLFKNPGVATPPQYAGQIPPAGQPYPQGQPMPGMAPHGAAPGYGPLKMLDTQRSLIKFILLSIVTCGIYGIIKMSEISQDINTIASRYDGKNTMHFCLVVFLLSPITCGIFTLIWEHGLADRMGMELRRRGIPFQISSTDFWLWGVLGAFIIVGPYIYLHKQLTAMNHLSADYNARG